MPQIPLIPAVPRLYMSIVICQFSFLKQLQTWFCTHWDMRMWEAEVFYNMLTYEELQDQSGKVLVRTWTDMDYRIWQSEGVTEDKTILCNCKALQIHQTFKQKILVSWRRSFGHHYHYDNDNQLTGWGQQPKNRNAGPGSPCCSCQIGLTESPRRERMLQNIWNSWHTWMLQKNIEGTGLYIIPSGFSCRLIIA